MPFQEVLCFKFATNPLAQKGHMAHHRSSMEGTTSGCGDSMTRKMGAIDGTEDE